MSTTLFQPCCHTSSDRHTPARTHVRVNTATMGAMNGVNLPRNPDAFQLSVNKTIDNVVENIRVVDRYCQQVLERLDDIQPRVKDAERYTKGALETNSKTEQAVKKLGEDLQTATRKIDQTNHNVDALRVSMKSSLDNRTNEINHTIATKVTQLHTRIDDLETGMNTRFDEFDGRISGVEGRLGNLEGKVTSLEAKVDGLERKVDNGFSLINSNLTLIANSLNVQLNTGEPRDPRAIRDEARRAADELATRPNKLLAVVESVIHVIVRTSCAHGHHSSELVIGSRHVAQIIQPAPQPLRPSPHSLHILCSHYRLYQYRFSSSLSPSSFNAVQSIIAPPPSLS